MERDKRLNDLPSSLWGKKAESRTSWRIVGRNIVLFVTVATLAGAASISRDVYLKRLNQVESMSVEERSRLERNFESFRKLTPAAKHHWREFHKRLESDPSLKATMDDYFEWLNSLENPYDREDLRKQNEIGKRAVMVNTLIAEQASEQRRKRFNEQLRAVDSSFLRRLGSWGPILPPEDLDQIMTHLESRLDLNEFQKTRLENLKNDGEDKGNLKLNIFIISQQDSFRLGADGTWPSRSVIEDLDNAVKIPEVASIAQISDEKSQRVDFIRLLLRSMMANEFLAKVNEIKPTKEQLSDYFKSLPEDRRARLLELSLEEQTQRLRSEYVASKMADNNQFGSREMMDFLKKLRLGPPPRGWSNRPPGGRGPGGRGNGFRPGERERTDKRRPGDRPDDRERDGGERPRRPPIED